MDAPLATSPEPTRSQRRAALLEASLAHGSTLKCDACATRPWEFIVRVSSRANHPIWESHLCQGCAVKAGLIP